MQKFGFLQTCGLFSIELMALAVALLLYVYIKKNETGKLLNFLSMAIVGLMMVILLITLVCALICGPNCGGGDRMDCMREGGMQKKMMFMKMHGGEEMNCMGGGDMNCMGGGDNMECSESEECEGSCEKDGDKKEIKIMMTDDGKEGGKKEIRIINGDTVVGKVMKKK